MEEGKIYEDLLINVDVFKVRNSGNRFIFYR